jgi:hypothetical protein
VRNIKLHTASYMITIHGILAFGRATNFIGSVLT